MATCDQAARVKRGAQRCIAGTIDRRGRAGSCPAFVHDLSLGRLDLHKRKASVVCTSGAAAGMICG